LEYLEIDEMIENFEDMGKIIYVNPKKYRNLHMIHLLEDIQL